MHTSIQGVEAARFVGSIVPEHAVKQLSALHQSSTLLVLLAQFCCGPNPSKTGEVGVLHDDKPTETSEMLC